MTFSPDVSNNPSNPHIQIKKILNSEIRLCVIKWNGTGESIEHMKKGRCKKTWKANQPRYEDCVEEWAKITPEQCMWLVSPYRWCLEAVITTKAFVQSIKYISVVQYFSLCHSILLHITSFLNLKKKKNVCMDYLGCYRHLVKMFMLTAPLEIYLLGEMVTCSILILPAVLFPTGYLIVDYLKI